MVQVMLQPRRDHGDDADASTTGASGNGVIDDVVFLHRAVPGTCRHARSTLALQHTDRSLLSTYTTRVLPTLFTHGSAHDSRLQRLLRLELRRARRHAGARRGPRAAGERLDEVE